MFLKVYDGNGKVVVSPDLPAAGPYTSVNLGTTGQAAMNMACRR